MTSIDNLYNPGQIQNREFDAANNAEQVEVVGTQTSTEPSISEQEAKAEQVIELIPEGPLESGENVVHDKDEQGNVVGWHKEVA